ncbi:MAG TPA: hypothetical protein VFO77_14595, partial [Actinoplanes sp.]|nr:hypothetical protein [Actinoplanes sp.]
DGPWANDWTATCVPTAVIQDELIAILKSRLSGQRPKLVGSQSCLDQHNGLSGATKFDLQDCV